jgi:hypothetical protein
MNTINTLIDFMINDDKDHEEVSGDLWTHYNMITDTQRHTIDNFLIKLCGVTYPYLLSESNRREKTGLYKYSLQK